MSTALMTPNKGSEAILISVTAETIKPMAEKYLALRIDGIADKAGQELVRRARLDCVKARTTCEKEHKLAKEDALRECQRIDKSRRDLLAMIAPVEKHLEDQEAAVEAAKEAIRKAAEDKVYAERLARWEAVEGPSTDRAYLMGMNEDQFAARIDQQTEAMNARKEAARIAAEQAEANRIERERLEAERAELERLRKAEAERIAAQQAELDRIKAEQEAEAERLRKIESDRIAAEQAEQRRIADEEAVKARQAEMERLTREAEERARIETEQRLKREAEERERQRLADEAEQRRQEEMKPMAAKMLAIADQIDAIKLPGEIPTASRAMFNAVTGILQTASRDIRASVKQHSKGAK